MYIWPKSEYVAVRPTTGGDLLGRLVTTYAQGLICDIVTNGHERPPGHWGTAQEAFVIVICDYVYDDYARCLARQA